MLVWALVAFGFGAGYSVFVVRYYRALEARRPVKAAGYDVLIGVLAAAPFQAWAYAGQSPVVLVAEILGSALGTYWAVK